MRESSMLHGGSHHTSCPRHRRCDAILEVNGERVKYAPVEKVVEAITRVAPDSGEM